MSNPFTEQVVANYDRPPQVVPQKVSRVIDGESNPASVWQDLVEAGLVPGNGHRKFAEPSDGAELWPSDRPLESEIPFSIQGVRTFSSDVAGKLKAEACATEFAQRLEPWGAVCDHHVVWYFSINTHEPPYLDSPYDSARDSVTLSLPKIGVETDTLVPSEESLPNLVRRALAAWEGWELAVQHDLPLDEPKWIDLRKWPHFSDLPNPFEPLLELWCTGYRIVSAFTSDDPTIRLYTKYVKEKADTE